MLAPESSKSVAVMDLDRLVSPRDIADAIGASESSLRRWIDSGDIRVSRTAGGHRRVTLRDAVQFVRKIGAVVVRPDLLHLPGANPSAEPVAEAEALFDALRQGHRDAAGGLALSWYMQGRPLHEFFDQPVRESLRRIGELWKHDERGILIEHRATAICLGMLATLHSLLPAPDPSAPLAIGAAPEGDPYQIPSMMAGVVLAEAGLREINYGAHTPLRLLTREAITTKARLVWLSISVAEEPRKLLTQLKQMAGELAEKKIQLVIGGHGSAELTRKSIGNAVAIRSMGELAAYGKGLLSKR